MQDQKKRQSRIKSIVVVDDTGIEGIGMKILRGVLSITTFFVLE
jgi:hypothetical protein